MSTEGAIVTRTDTTLRDAALLPGYFGDPGRPLYGCYHRPAHEAPLRDTAMLLCAPFGPEYFLSHRSLRQFAIGLSALGFPALRFDYHGCGDSAGDSEEASLTQWTGDVDRAAKHLRQLARRPKLALAGLRLGASLGAVYAARSSSVDRMLLWDPIVNGGAYLQEMHERHLALERELGMDHHVEPGFHEFQGYRYSEAMVREIAALDLLALSPRPSKKVLLLETLEEPVATGLRGHLDALGVTTRHEHLPAPSAWARPASQGLVPREPLDAALRWARDDGGRR